MSVSLHRQASSFGPLLVRPAFGDERVSEAAGPRNRIRHGRLVGPRDRCRLIHRSVAVDIEAVCLGAGIVGVRKLGGGKRGGQPDRA
jgi:hypothetical protein